LEGKGKAAAALLANVANSSLGVPSPLKRFALKAAKQLLGPAVGGVHCAVTIGEVQLWALISLAVAAQDANVCMIRKEVGWDLIAALASLGPAFIERKLEDMAALWKTALVSL
jgi:hypothetical protein